MLFASDVFFPFAPHFRPLSWLFSMAFICFSALSPLNDSLVAHGEVIRPELQRLDQLVETKDSARWEAFHSKAISHLCSLSAKH